MLVQWLFVSQPLCVSVLLVCLVVALTVDCGLLFEMVCMSNGFKRSQVDLQPLDFVSIALVLLGVFVYRLRPEIPPEGEGLLDIDNAGDIPEAGKSGWTC